MKERPILFSAPMVRALLDGSKMQTRRIVKPQPRILAGELLCWKDDALTTEQMAERCPYGQLGDRLFVRETFFAYGRWITQFNAKKGREEWHFIDMTKECDRAYQYASDNPDIPLATGRGPLPGWYRRPAIFMPRIACRISLEIVSVRVERLQELSEADAYDEGITCENVIVGAYYSNGHIEEWADRFFFDGCDDEGFEYAVDAYAALWESINGAGSWDANPFVWVMSFKRVEQ